MMKPKIKNAKTDKNFDIPFSLLYIAPKHKNEPRNKSPNPKVKRSSNDFEKTNDKLNKRIPIIANTTDKILKRCINHSPFYLLFQSEFPYLQNYQFYSAKSPDT